MKVCPVCEGYTASSVARCSSCDVALVDTSEVAWAARAADSAGFSPWIGRVVAGKYRVAGVLGKGGMGTVYRAVHEVSHSKVALKVLHPRFAGRVEFKRTLIAEARRASRLRSEYVARVVDVGETPEGSVFFAMELVEGETLHDWVRRARALPAPVVAELMLQLCAALADAESAGVVHRDLSPKNVMIERHGDGFRAKVLDFGIARVAGAEPEPGAEDTRVWVNPPYTAPELLTGETGDFRADLYSVGVIAYEALSGRLPHGGATLKERVREVMEREPAQLVPGAPAPRPLVKLVRDLIAKDPAGRPRSAAAVRERLSKLRRPHGVGFQVAAIAVLIAGSTAFLTRFAEQRVPAIQSSSGSAMILSERLQRDATPQYLREEDLAQLRLQLVDVGPGELAVRGWLAGSEEPLFDRPLGGTIAGGELLLDKRDEDWSSVVGASAATGLPVNLDVRHVPTNRLLAFARIFVDRRAPVLRLEEDLPRVLTPASTLQVRCDEDGDGADLVLELRKGGDVLAASAQQRLTPGVQSLPVGSLLAAGLTRGSTLDDVAVVQLVWKLTDRAGRPNRGSWALASADLSRPVISDVTGPDGGTTLEVDQRRCRLRVVLAHAEPRLAGLFVQVMSGEDRQSTRTYGEREIELDGRSLTATIEVPAAGNDTRVDLDFWVRDAAGNESERFRREFTLRSLALRPAFSADAPAGTALLDSDSGVLFVARKSAVRVRYACNDSYRPAPEGAGIARDVESARGGCQFTLGPLDDVGRHTISVSHDPVDRPGGPIATKVRLEVYCLPDPPAVEPVPECVAEPPVWTRRVLQTRVLELAGANEVRIGTGLPVFVEAESRAAGRVWTERRGSWIPATERLDLRSGEDLRRPKFELVPGRNRIAIEITDRLGRGVVDRQATGVAGRRVTAGAARLVMIADFRHDATPPRTAEVDVELDYPVLVTIQDDQTFDPGARIELIDERTQSYRFESSPVTSDGATVARFEIPFDSLRDLCGWPDVLSVEDFVATSPSEVPFTYGSPAGDFAVKVTFRPAETLLRTTDLGALRADGGAEVRAIRMVPFLAPPRDYAIDLGPPAGQNVRGSVVLPSRVRVEGLTPFFLSHAEITRAVWARFVDDVVEACEAGRVRAASLCHKEDPVPASERVTAAGLAPDLSMFPAPRLDAVTRVGGDRPITGVHYFQAQVFVRWLGWRAFGDPSLFRLPFGAELEWATLGPQRGERGPLNGMQRSVFTTVRGAVRSFEATQRSVMLGQRVDAGGWPLSTRQLDAIGDWVLSRDRVKVFGLDFGVREWVEDLPLAGAPPEYRLIASIHAQHADFVRKRGAGERLPGHSPPLEKGELRGLGWGEPPLGGTDPRTHLVDVYGGGDLAGLLGVKRMNYLRRDGSGLTRRVTSPLVRVAGFRVAGGERFTSKVRAKR